MAAKRGTKKVAGIFRQAKSWQKLLKIAATRVHSKAPQQNASFYSKRRPQNGKIFYPTLFRAYRMTEA